MKRALLVGAACCLLGAAFDAAHADSPVQERNRFLAGAFRHYLRDHPRQTCNDCLAWLLDREATLRLLSIFSGTQPGDKSSGWLVPTRTRMTAAALLQRLDRDGDGRVALSEFGGPREWFRKLDRDRDSFVSASDLDWSPQSPLAKANSEAKKLFRAVDQDGDSKISAAEWQEYLQTLAQGKDHLIQDDLIPLFASGGSASGKRDSRFNAGSINVPLFKAFFEGDVASLFEGPRPGTAAPDFTLPTPDGKSSFTLSSQYGKRPTVLNFGSFT